MIGTLILTHSSTLHAGLGLSVPGVNRHWASLGVQKGRMQYLAIHSLGGFDNSEDIDVFSGHIWGPYLSYAAEGSPGWKNMKSLTGAELGFLFYRAEKEGGNDAESLPGTLLYAAFSYSLVFKNHLFLKLSLCYPMGAGLGLGVRMF